jgi:hypothetical protein
VPRLHISQDHTGYWQLALEEDDGTLSLLSHQFPSPDHLIEDARELVAEGKVPGGVILIGPETQPRDRVRSIRQPYSTPAPQKVAE